jgi:hypothetical protein
MQYALIAQQALAQIPRIHQNATVAVTQAAVDGAQRYVFAVYGTQTAFQRVEDYAHGPGMNGVAFHAQGDHAEVYLHKNYASNPGFTKAIGHSNYNGTCDNCQAYFDKPTVKFFNVWWDEDAA